MIVTSGVGAGVAAALGAVVLGRGQTRIGTPAVCVALLKHFFWLEFQ